MSRWVLKPVELFRASSKVLGLKHPVSVKQFSGWWAGEYNPFPLHVVWVNKKVTANWKENPSWTIWHELGHALQCERDFGGDGATYEKFAGLLYSHLVDDQGEPILNGMDWEEWLDSYDEIPLEQEANEIADRYYERYPLVTIKRYKMRIM